MVKRADTILRGAQVPVSVATGEDLYQDICVKLLGGATDESLVINPWAYISTMLHNMVITIIRTHKRSRLEPRSAFNYISEETFDYEPILNGGDDPYSIENFIIARELYEYVFYGTRIAGRELLSRKFRDFEKKSTIIRMRLKDMEYEEIHFSLPRPDYLPPVTDIDEAWKKINTPRVIVSGEREAVAIKRAIDSYRSIYSCFIIEVRESLKLSRPPSAR